MYIYTHLPSSNFVFLLNKFIFGIIKKKKNKPAVSASVCILKFQMEIFFNFNFTL